MSIRESLEKVRDNVWELPSSYKKEMRVPGRMYLDDEAVQTIEEGVCRIFTLDTGSALVV